MQKQIALVVSLLVLVAAAQVHAVEILGVSTGTAHCAHVIEMAQACHATFATSRVCDSKDLKRATSIAPLPAPNGSDVTLLFHPVPKAAMGSTNMTIVDELGIPFSGSGMIGGTCGRYTQRALDGVALYVIDYMNPFSSPPAYQVLCCSDQ